MSHFTGRGSGPFSRGFFRFASVIEARKAKNPAADKKKTPVSASETSRKRLFKKPRLGGLIKALIKRPGARSRKRLIRQSRPGSTNSASIQKPGARSAKLLGQ